jgi:hypothetical protein
MSYKATQKQAFSLKSNACEFCVDANARSIGTMALTKAALSHPLMITVMQKARSV